MTRAYHLSGLCGLCIALAGCATHAVGPGASAGPANTQTASAQLTLDTPNTQICDDPRGRSVLDRNLPALRKNPNYMFFKVMSLRQLAGMSGGRITAAKLEQVRLDLAAAPGATR